MTVFVDFCQCTDGISFLLEVHGQIRIFPVTQYAQAFKVNHLQVNLAFGIVTASAAKLGRRHDGTVFAFVFMGLTHFTDNAFYLLLNRQPMTIPARYIRRVITVKRLVFDNHVFKHFIHHVTQVNLTIGIGRAIMQYILFTTLTSATNLGIHIVGKPLF